MAIVKGFDSCVRFATNFVRNERVSAAKLSASRGGNTSPSFVEFHIAVIYIEVVEI